MGGYRWRRVIRPSARNYFSFGLSTSIENQVSVKVVITVPYQLGEGEVVNYLIESHGDVIKSS